ncbi:Hypothetical predicted protein [Octopus vulgaris]|uniref:Uncharacterized protein n=1 Tax=Octopus vulgaris TaxID=6645 RepID=A0AA36B7P7_OCTVU|nr:Hypothetical predicted protein [Octopus vulgaris]
MSSEFSALGSFRGDNRWNFKNIGIIKECSSYHKLIAIYASVDEKHSHRHYNLEKLQEEAIMVSTESLKTMLKKQTGLILSHKKGQST